HTPHSSFCVSARSRLVSRCRRVHASTASGFSWHSRCSERSAAQHPSIPCRSARLRTRLCGGRRSRRLALWAVELRREESRRGLQDRISAAQLAILAFQLGNSGGLIGRGARPGAGIDLGLLDQPRRVSELIPSWSPTRRQMFLPLLPGSALASSTSRIARSRSSLGYFRGAAIAPRSWWVDSLHQTRHGSLIKITRWRSQLTTPRRSPARDSYTTSEDAAWGHGLLQTDNAVRAGWVPVRDACSSAVGPSALSRWGRGAGWQGVSTRA